MNDFSSLLFLCNFVQAVLFWFKSLEQLPYLENMDDAKTKGEKEEKYDFLWFTWLVSFSFASKKYKVSFLKLSPPSPDFIFLCVRWMVHYFIKCAQVVPSRDRGALMLGGFMATLYMYTVYFPESNNRKCSQKADVLYSAEKRNTCLTGKKKKLTIGKNSIHRASGRAMKIQK